MIKTTESDLRKSFESYGTIVDINLKYKNTGIVFAFIEFDSVDSARSAVEAYSNFYGWNTYISPFLFALKIDLFSMNKKTLMERELKV